MSSCNRGVRFEFRRETQSGWNPNFVLLSGEPGVETDTGQMKLGDGVRPWSQLPYVGTGGVGGGSIGPTGPTGRMSVNEYSSVGGTGYLIVNNGTTGSTGIQYSNAFVLGPSVLRNFEGSTGGPVSGIATNSSEPTVYVNADILPTVSGRFNLGSQQNRFKSMHVGADTIYLGSSALSTDTAGNVVITSSDGTSAVPSTNENFMISVGVDDVCSMKYSTNATTWTNAKSGPSGPTGTAPPLHIGLTVVWTGSIWLAGGVASGLTGGSSILKSNNGREWFTPAITTDPFTQYGPGFGSCNSIAYNASQNRFVAIGSQGDSVFNTNHMFYSDDDANTWTPINYTPTAGASLYGIKVATDGGNNWYLIDAGSTDGAGFAYRSNDGINWVSANYNGMFSTRSIHYNGHYWLACGGNGSGGGGNVSIVKSYDGNTWTPVFGSFPDGVNGENEFNGADIAWNGIYWVCVGQGTGSNLWTSQDGDNWTKRTDFDGGENNGLNLTTIAWNGELWVAGGSFREMVDIEGKDVERPTVSFIVSNDTIDWYAVSGAAFTGNPQFTASRRVLPFGGSPHGSGGAGGATGPTGAAGYVSTLTPNATGLIPTMTSESQAGFTISASSEFTPGNFQAWRACDGITGTDWAAQGSGFPSWWQVQCPSPVAIWKFEISQRATDQDEYLSNFTFQGSVNGTAWTTLASVTGNLADIGKPPALLTIPVNDPTFTPYSYYRITGSSGVGPNPGFAMFQMYDFTNNNQLAIGPTGPTGPAGTDGATGASSQTTTTLEFVSDPEEGDARSGIQVDTGLAYISGNSVIFTYNPAGENIGFEAIVVSYDSATGIMNVNSITNVRNSLVGTYLYNVNIAGQRGTKIFRGTDAPSINARPGDLYIDSNNNLYIFQ